ncbi:MAG: hypothetical protein ACM3TR_01450 [Caulobacteraceae bacterium]
MLRADFNKATAIPRGMWRETTDTEKALRLNAVLLYYSSPDMGSNLAVKVRYGLGSGNH